MSIIDNAYMPYDFAEKRNCLKYLISRCFNIKKSIKLIEKDTEHLTVRCPVSGDYLDVVGDPDDIRWLHNELIRQDWYKP